MKRWFIPAAARVRGQSNDLNREILASNLFNCHKEVINAPPVPSISRYIHIVYRHKNVWEYQWSNLIYNCMSTFLHYVCCKDALLDCSAPGGERCESLTWVDEIYNACKWWIISWSFIRLFIAKAAKVNTTQHFQLDNCLPARDRGPYFIIQMNSIHSNIPLCWLVYYIAAI